MRISERVPYTDLIQAELIEVKRKQNAREARRMFGHPPTLFEMVCHFICTGRDQMVIAALGDENIFFTGTELGADPLSLPRRRRIHALLSHYKRYHGATMA